MTFTPSPYQRAIFDWVANDDGNAIVQAVAGSGKTTTIVEATKRFDPEERVLFLAFNKAIVEELRDKLPDNAEAATFHSKAFAALRRLGISFKLDTNKTRNLIRTAQELDLIDPKELDDLLVQIVKLIGYAKNGGVGIYTHPDDMSVWQTMIDYYGVDSGDHGDDRLIEIAWMVFSAGNHKVNRTVIDFDDMLYQSVKHNVAFPQYDWVLVDEAQDTNALQRAILHKLLAPNGRLIAVGDRNQALYSFRGADSTAMDLIAHEFSAIELPLSISYRCPRKVVELAQAIVPHIEASDRAPEGSVVTLNEWDPSVFTATDAVICRLNAPLITLAYRVIRSGRGCKIVGRDIGQGLISLIKRMKAANIDDLEEKLSAWMTRELTKANAKEDAAKAQRIEDQCESIFAAIDASNLDDNGSVDALCASISRLFDDSANGSVLTLSTIHRAKGREWNRVYILDRQLMPSKWATRDWQIEGERCCEYVAITRARQELVFIETEKGR